MAFQIRNLFLVLCLATAFVACKEDFTGDCNKTCTKQYVYILVSFKTAAGATAEIKNYQAINLRTGKVLMEGDEARMDIWGAYIVAGDSQLDLLSENGDMVEVRATSVAAEETATATFKIKGGRCNCHVEKVIGPKEIVFSP
ncbi:hypothetical protein [Pedobacter deserti]|uniref:hypothetical protein n=1 Tax=Pedobacter deserti TaxID=2817382 RepID=UPI00210A6B25|nr:hypothetical protein [Pedobacter sp. SYSU D00382]